MDFRLTFEGPLNGPTGGNSRVAHKHDIRKKFHRQLKRLWEVNPFLNSKWTTVWDQNKHLESTYGASRATLLAPHFRRGAFTFIPLVERDLSLLCSINILFLRPDQPGDTLKSGDIDNRLKTIFDALCIPQHLEQLGGITKPDEGEEPFFCLLEDDSLITHLSVETDMLLQPTGERFDVNDARLVITVKIRPYNVNPGNQGFG